MQITDRYAVRKPLAEFSRKGSTNVVFKFMIAVHLGVPGQRPFRQ
jgi:hypothetical protein